MHEQYRLRCQQYSLSCDVWTAQTSPHHPPSIVIAPVECTNWSAFRTYVEELISRRRIARVIMDEAHLGLTHDGFRPVMDTLKWVGGCGVQVVLESATVPLSLEDELLSAYGLTACYVSRSHSVRSNISYQVVRSSQSSLAAEVKRVYLGVKDHSHSNRVLIFCRSKPVAQSTSAELGIPYCDASLSQEDIDTVLVSFRRGTERRLCCTSLLGVGLDVPDITHVIHYGYPRDVISFVQEVGRLGRDDATSKAWSIVVLPPLTSNRVPVGRFGERLMKVALDCDDHCRRLLVQMYMDGQAEPCTLLGGHTHLCDICAKKMHMKPKTPIRPVFPYDLMNDGLGSA